MNKKIINFLDDVCIHIKCKAVHKDIREELTNHINELKDDYVKAGNDEEKAVELAISAMGSCDEIGSCLNKQHAPKTEWSLIALTAVIAFIGGIIMYTSSRFESLQAVSFEKYLFFAVIGIGVLVGLCFFDYTKLKRLAFPIYVITFLSLLFTLFTGASFNGRSFLTIGSITVSADYIPVLFLVSIAGFIEKSRGKGSIAIAKILLLALISLLPIIALPRLSTVIVLMICYSALIISSVIKRHFGGHRKLQLTCLGAIGILIIFIAVFGIVSEPYRLDRISSFITRGQSDPNGAGWTQAMADKCLSSSVLFGKSAATIDGCSIDKVMPGITTNYVLVNVISTLGWVAGIALISVIAVFIGRMFATTKKIKNTYGFYLSLGACTILSVQFAISILINFNLFPQTDVILPFISYGGVGYIANMALVGIILSVWRRNNLISSPQKTAVANKDKFIKFEDGKLIISFK